MFRCHGWPCVLPSCEYNLASLSGFLLNPSLAHQSLMASHDLVEDSVMTANAGGQNRSMVLDVINRRLRDESIRVYFLQQVPELKAVESISAIRSKRRGRYFLTLCRLPYLPVRP
jgi:hypothetical protein